MSGMSDFDGLAESGEMWTYLGFEPWAQGDMRGVARQITMVKGSLMLPIAKYYAWDYIVWRYRDKTDVDRVMREWRPLPDVVTQRFLFIGGPSSKKRLAKSFWLGLRGFLEVYFYTPGGDCHPKVRDLIPAVNMAWERKGTGKKDP
ncbi:MAG: hypothetical protein LBQ90_02935 [Synergistaceae bacterium]|nr:hypothetical protein [Synergistaceae bacterium]